MDTLPTLPPPDVGYSRPLRGRLSALGLNGATVAGLAYGGLPSPPSASEPAGDAGDGVDLPVRLGAPQAPDERSGGYALRPGLPSTATLDYVHKFSSATLVTLALVLLIVYAVARPRRALRLLEGRAGGGS